MKNGQLVSAVESQLQKNPGATPAATPAPQPQKQAAFWPEFSSMEQLLSRPADPTRWIWHEVLPVSAASVLVAKPRVGKSTLAANLCIAVARGLPLLGRETQKSAVAYVFTDGSEWEIAETFQTVGARADDQIFTYAGQTPQKAIPWLMEKVKKFGARLIVIDTLQRMLHIREINDYSQVVNMTEPVVNAARQEGCHIMLVHHAGKGANGPDSAIGSIGIKGMVYSYLWLDKLDSEKRVITSEQRGGKNFPGLAIDFGPTGFLEVKGTAEEAEIDQAITEIADVLTADDDAEPTEKEIRSLVHHRGVIVSKAIRKMLKDNRLERTGTGKRGNAFRYALSPSLLQETGFESQKSSPSLFSQDKKESIQSGTRIEDQQQAVRNNGVIEVPKNADTNGTRKEANSNGHSTGRESLVSKALEIFGGKIVEEPTK